MEEAPVVAVIWKGGSVKCLYFMYIMWLPLDKLILQVLCPPLRLQHKVIFKDVV